MLIDAQLLCEGEKKMGCGAGKWAAVSNHTQRPSVASTSSAVSGASSEGGRVSASAIMTSGSERLRRRKPDSAAAAGSFGVGR